MQCDLLCLKRGNKKSKNHKRKISMQKHLIRNCIRQILSQSLEIFILAETKTFKKFWKLHAPNSLNCSLGEFFYCSSRANVLNSSVKMLCGIYM